MNIAFGFWKKSEENEFIATEFKELEEKSTVDFKCSLLYTSVT